MFLQQPAWLILVAPLGALWALRPLPSRGLQALRALVLALLLLGLCRPTVELPSRTGTVVVVVDRSESMPPGSDRAAQEVVQLAQARMRASDRLGVVAFGRTAAVEQAPQGGRFAGFAGDIGRDHSDLAAAIDAAGGLIGNRAAGRILLVTDGQWTGSDPLDAAVRLAARGIPADYRLLRRPGVNDLSIAEVQAPQSVEAGEAFMIIAAVRAPVGQAIRYELARGGRSIASGRRVVPAGVSRLAFRDRAESSGLLAYRLTVAAEREDPVPENNAARLFVAVEGQRRVLLVSPSGAASGLKRALAAGGLAVDAVAPEECDAGIEGLAPYACLVLENAPAGALGESGMANAAAWVESMGKGLMMTGGRKSYGPGGYFRSPLERVLPVSMELRQEHRKLSLAIAVTLDRSGSMAVPAGGGKTKMDLANLGTVQVLDLLSPLDEIGVIAVDSSPHTIVGLDTAERNAGARGRILRIDSQGGGIFIYEALQAAVRMLTAAKAQTRHVILFADAADSEEPGAYRALLEKAQAAGVTVSVVGLGTPGDCDAELLRDVARRGGGECYFTADPGQIPRLFAQDTFAVARSTFIEAATEVKLTAALRQVSDYGFSAPPPVGGYNLCYLRPGAAALAVTGDEYAAPLAAAWNAGSGRVLCFTAEADGADTGPFGRWADAGRFLAAMAGWAAGPDDALPEGMLLTQEVREGQCVIELHLDPERPAQAFAGAPDVRLLHGLPGAPPAVETVALRWKNADLLAAEVPLRGAETLMATVNVPGGRSRALSPVCLPYSPEFAPEDARKGAASLEQVAAATGGRERVDVAGIWDDLPRRPRSTDLTPWLIALAMAAFLMEVFERRTGLLSARRRKAAPSAADAAPGAPRTAPAAHGRPASAPAAAVAAAAPGAPGPAAPAEGGAPPASAPQATPQDEWAAALRQARKQADERTGRRP